MSFEKTYGRDGLMITAAVRYCIGRMTYIVSDCADWIIANWDEWPERVQAIIKRDLEEAFRDDDNDRADARKGKRDWLPLGHDCDRAQWERVRKLWRKAVIVPLEMPPLFIPLKAEFFDAFMDGSKPTEFRVYGPRWNERTCPVGRRVTISKGYGIKHRAAGLIVGFEVSEEPTKTEAWRRCYGEKPGAMAACIHILLDKKGASA